MNKFQREILMMVLGKGLDAATSIGGSIAGQAVGAGLQRRAEKKKFGDFYKREIDLDYEEDIKGRVKPLIKEQVKQFGLSPKPIEKIRAVGSLKDKYREALEKAGEEMPKVGEYLRAKGIEKKSGDFELPEGVTDTISKYQKGKEAVREVIKKRPKTKEKRKAISDIYRERLEKISGPKELGRDKEERELKIKEEKAETYKKTGGKAADYYDTTLEKSIQGTGTYGFHTYVDMKNNKILSGDSVNEIMKGESNKYDGETPLKRGLSKKYLKISDSSGGRHLDKWSLLEIIDDIKTGKDKKKNIKLLKADLGETYFNKLAEIYPELK